MTTTTTSWTIGACTWCREVPVRSVGGRRRSARDTVLVGPSWIGRVGGECRMTFFENWELLGGGGCLFFGVGGLG